MLTLGCRVNQYETEFIRSQWEKAGGVECGDMDNAQYICINSCAVTSNAERESRNAIYRARRSNPEAYIIMTGCAARLFNSFRPRKNAFWAEPDAIICNKNDLLAGPKGLAENSQDFFPPGILETSRHSRPVVKAQDGCDRYCAYCIVPFTRGRQKSRQEHEILEECGRRLARGAREITLLGQNVNAWGKDNGQGSFAGLLRKIAALPGLERLHYITPHPKDMTAEDARVFGELPVLCPRLHLPLQSGSDKVLAAMRRRYSSREYLDLVETLKNARPDIALSTDIIVGFPGESEADFLATLELLRKCSFVSSFSFCYSDRPGARAALFPHKIPPAIQQDRLLRFQAMQEEITEKWLAGRVGQKALVLLEGKSPRQADGQESWQGRDEYGAIVHVPVNEAFAGQMIACRIEAARRHSLVGRQEG